MTTIWVEQKMKGNYNKKGKKDNIEKKSWKQLGGK